MHDRQNNGLTQAATPDWSVVCGWNLPLLYWAEMSAALIAVFAPSSRPACRNQLDIPAPLASHGESGLFA